MANTLECLKNISLFENLNDEELELLKSFATKRFFNEGEILFYEKDIPKSLILLSDGMLKVYKTDPKNHEVILHRFMPYTLVAEMVTMEGIPYPASAVFLSDGSVIEIDFEKFKEAFFSNPEIAFKFFQSLAAKIKNLERVISLNVVLDSTARVAKYIYENEDALTMRHNHLAQYLHMTPETLSRMFKKLLTLGLLEKDAQGYKILNKEGLKALFE